MDNLETRATLGSQDTAKTNKTRNTTHKSLKIRGRHGRDRMQSMHITTTVVSSLPAHDVVCSIQHYVIKFVSDLRYVGDFLWVPLFHPPIKLSATDMNRKYNTQRKWWKGQIMIYKALRRKLKIGQHKTY